MPSSSATDHSIGRSSNSLTTAASSCRARTPTTRCPSRATPTASWALACRGPTSPRRSRGTYQYVQHIRLPGMLHGRVVWPRGQGAHGISNPTVASIDEASIAGIPGVQIVRRNNFVGVVAEREGEHGCGSAGCRAASQLKVTWEPFAAALPGHEGLFDSFKSAKTNDLIDTDAGDVDAALARAAHVVSADVSRPVPIARRDGAELRRRRRDQRRRARDLLEPSDLSDALRPGAVARPCRSTRSACSTPRARTPTATAATARPRTRPPILSQEVGRPVRLQLSRADELGWDNYGPALLSEVRAAVDADGKLVALDYQAWSHATAWLETASQLALGTPPPTSGFGVPAAGPGGAGLFSVHLSQTDMYDVAESPHRQSRRHRRRLLANRRVARADGPVDVLRARRRDGRARARREARSVRVPQAQHLARALARRARSCGRCCEVDPARRGVATFERESRHGPRHRPSARTTCRRTRAIASPTRRPSSTSR